MLRSPAATAHQEGTRSWILPEATSEDLLYVLEASVVNIYSLKTGKIVGALTGFNYSRGLCVDNEQDVWVTQETRTDASTITEFAHGKKKPLRVLQDNAGFAYACAVDPTTDNLTVINELGPGSMPGNVIVFSKDAAAPRIYHGSQIHTFFSGGYDGAGNLLVVGSVYSVGIRLAELKRDSNALIDVSYNGPTYELGDGVQWDGQYWVLGSGYGEAYQVDVSGSYGTVVNTINLDNDTSFDVSLFGNTLIGGDANGSHVFYYKYPQGGYPTKTISKDLDHPAAAVVSAAPRLHVSATEATHQYISDGSSCPLHC